VFVVLHDQNWSERLSRNHLSVTARALFSPIGYHLQTHRSTGSAKIWESFAKGRDVTPPT